MVVKRGVWLCLILKWVRKCKFLLCVWNGVSQNYLGNYISGCYSLVFVKVFCVNIMCCVLYVNIIQNCGSFLFNFWVLFYFRAGQFFFGGRCKINRGLYFLVLVFQDVLKLNFVLLFKLDIFLQNYNGIWYFQWFFMFFLEGQFIFCLLLRIYCLFDD